jgi:hypothetical protein
MEELGVNPFKMQRFTLECRLEEISCGGVAVTHEQEGRGFINDIIGGEKTVFFVSQLGLKPKGSAVVFVGSIPESEKAGRIHEDFRSGHKGFDLCQHDGSFLLDLERRAGQW